MTARPRLAQAGFSLIEVLIAVALFALIGLAAFAVVENMINVQLRTDGRLEELAVKQRAMFILTTDFEQLQPETLVFDGAVLSFRRPHLNAAGALSVSYSVSENTLWRTLSSSDGAKRAQPLLQDIDAVNWKFFVEGGGWVAALPAPADDAPGVEAVELDLKISAAAELSGDLSRVVLLPQRVRK